VQFGRTYVCSQEISVAAAADLQFAMQDIAGDSRRRRKDGKADLRFAGNFLAADSDGAPFEIFLFRDLDYPKKLESAGLTEPEATTSTQEGRSWSGFRGDSKARFEFRDEGFCSIPR